MSKLELTIGSLFLGFFMGIAFTQWEIIEDYGQCRKQLTVGEKCVLIQLIAIEEDNRAFSRIPKLED